MALLLLLLLSACAPGVLGESPPNSAESAGDGGGVGIMLWVAERRWELRLAASCTRGLVDGVLLLVLWVKESPSSGGGGGSSSSEEDNMAFACLLLLTHTRQ